MKIVDRLAKYHLDYLSKNEELYEYEHPPESEIFKAGYQAAIVELATTTNGVQPDVPFEYILLILKHLEREVKD